MKRAWRKCHEAGVCCRKRTYANSLSAFTIWGNPPLSFSLWRRVSLFPEQQHHRFFYHIPSTRETSYISVFLWRTYRKIFYNLKLISLCLCTKVANVLGSGNMQILKALTETGKPSYFIFIFWVADSDL